MTQIYYCYHINEAKERFILPDIIYLKKKGQICFYDDQEKIFFGIDRKPIDINGKIIIPISFIPDAQELFEKIAEAGGKIPGGIENVHIVENWIDVYSPKRKVQKVTGRDLLNGEFLENLENTYGPEIFFKTIEKSYNEIIQLNDLKVPNTVIRRALSLHQDEEFIISEVVDIMRDNIGTKEYRIFVFENEVLNISRYTECFLHKIDPIIYEKAKEIVAQMQEKPFPTSYVLDLFEYYDKDGNPQLDVVEFNGFTSAGRYLYNSVEHTPSDDMLHDNPTNIAIERRMLAPLCLVPHPKYKNFINGQRSSIYCSTEGSFAYDLKSLHQYGNVIDGGYDFELGRVIDEDIDSCWIVQTSNKNITTKIDDIIKQVRTDSEKRSIREFYDSLLLEECPLEIDCLVREQLPDNPEEELPSEIRVSPDVLTKLKQKYGN